MPALLLSSFAWISYTCLFLFGDQNLERCVLDTRHEQYKLKYSFEVCNCTFVSFLGTKTAELNKLLKTDANEAYLIGILMSKKTWH